MDSGKLVVISAPSGAGKTTIARAVLAAHPGLEFSVSATTRRMRPGEKEGTDYYFLSRADFERRIQKGEFIEWEVIYGNYYGTLRNEVERTLRAGKHVLFDVDVKGALSIRRMYPETLLVFLRPPSLEALERRLRGRMTEDETTLQERMRRVPMEIELGNTIATQVINDELQRAISDVNRIVDAYLQQD
jgi:guanylate kinase